MATGVLDELRKLHTILEELREVRDSLERGPRQVKARQQYAAQKAADLEAGRQKQKMLKLTADQKSLQLKTHESKLVDLQAKLNQASSNREYDILRSQIEADTMAKSVLEDEILETLELVEQAGAEIKKQEQDLATAKSEEARVQAEIAAAEGGLKAREAALTASLLTAETFLTGEPKQKYTRMVQAYGVGAMAEVTGNTCGSCYMSMPPQIQVQLRSGEVVFCKSCGRLLFVGEPVESA